MKKFTLVFASAMIIASMFTITSCTKTDDTGAPVITLKGDNPDRVVYKSAANYTDPGYTVADNEDKPEDITVVVDGVSAVNMNSAGNYNVVYTATDKAGNVGTKTREVTVDAALYLNGSFTVEDFDASNVSQGTYPENISSSTINFNKINFTKFAFYQNATVYGTILGNTITIPQQTVTCGLAPNIADRTFTGSGTFTNPNTFNINYSETTNSVTVTGHGVYTRN